MHCLGAVTNGTPSPNGVASRDGILSVFRALGVLVCEGRIQGPPRGYKEGPHCAAPMHQAANNHACEKDNYLCDRYLVLLREIADRTASGSYLCVEVLLCSDCPCGLSKATCKHPVCVVPSLSISPWQHTSEMLLEYWCISVIPSSSKCPETMNFQGLYQAVRSRLHFSQVAAWWSRSNGTSPSYVATRVVSYNEENLGKFRDIPIEHTFPLAGNGDGNAIKVTVWALPRMEEVPVLACPIHPVMENGEELAVARALTPTKPICVQAVATSSNPECLVLPTLVDDRLQTPCNKPGKHHCRCEEEDVSPPSPSIQRPAGERKRRRSLPCGPSEVGTPCVTTQPATLPSVQESYLQGQKDCGDCSTSSYCCASTAEDSTGTMRAIGRELSNGRSVQEGVQQLNNLNFDNLERCFRRQLNIHEQQGNREKRCKLGAEAIDDRKLRNHQVDSKKENSAERKTERNGLFVNYIPFNASLPWSFVESWNNCNAGKCTFQGLRNAKAHRDSEKIYGQQTYKDTPITIDPFKQTSPFHEANPGPSTHSSLKFDAINNCTVHQSCSKSASNKFQSSSKNLEGKGGSDIRTKPGKDLSQMMSKLAFPEDKDEAKGEGGFLEWFSRVPGRVLGVAPAYSQLESKSKNSQKSNDQETKFKNCNLELSQREFNEVLAVLRARTPSGRRRAPLKSAKRRDAKLEKPSEDGMDKTKHISFDGVECPTHFANSTKIYEACTNGVCKKTEGRISDATDTSHKIQKRVNSTNDKDGNAVISDSDGDGDGEADDDASKKSNNSVCLQNVSNKADVLLGAILRTSKERSYRLADISNGTRCRIAIPTNELEDQAQDSKIMPYGDDKSLPQALNKRFNRFKQLFKKEPGCSTTDGYTEDEALINSVQRRNTLTTNTSRNIVQPSLHIPRHLRDSKIKRKIDFSDMSVEANEPQKDTLIKLGQHDAHKTRVHSRNYNDFPKDNSEPDEQAVSTSDESIDDIGHSHKRKTPLSIDCNKIPLQNGFLSSKMRNNNYKNDLDMDEDEDETFDKATVPSAIEQERFRRSLENAASMVFHSRTGLPLTSSPAPLRRGSCCFDYDSTLNSVSSKRSALFELNTPPSPGAVSLEETDRETENPGEGEEQPRRRSASRHRPQSHALLGNFEESALNGRLEPVSTVHGFTAELGASGSFCPKHRKLPVTVFFYTLGDNDKVSTPYLAHINLEKKGYQVPRSGTIQVTLLNPLGTVVKMFVVLYDLSDMPPRSHTFLRQRTLRDKTLRYLVHLRFMSGKTGRIYLHTDIRMIICRKSDMDTASDFASEPPKELRSYIHGPTNPKFSPRC
ncbi:atos homolog protein A isoform X2 [Prorops nasuta]